MTQNGSEPKGYVPVDFNEDYGVAWEKLQAQKALELETIAFPGMVPFIIHVGQFSAIEGRAEFKSGELTAYLTAANARTIYEVVRKGATIKAHLSFEIHPDVRKSDDAES